MEHSHPLSRLSADIAAIRAQHRTLRLVLRNTERFGLIHLYFERGHLTRVQGHKETALKSFEDLISWDQGAIREDDLPEGQENEGLNPSLEQALDTALQELERRGVIAPPPPSAQPSRAPSPPYYDVPTQNLYTQPPSPYPPQTPPYAPYAGVGVGVGGREPVEIPEMPAAQQHWPSQSPSLANFANGPQPPDESGGFELFSDMQTIPIASANPGDYLADSQWQLLALVVRQAVEQAGAIVGKDTADGLIRQALAYGAVKQPPLRMLEIDATGWLSPMQGQRVLAFPLSDIADAIATLLTSFENRCASLVGQEEAHRILVTAARPFSASLAQLGLAIAV